MSLEAMTAVWSYSQLAGNDFLTLLAIADHADPETAEAYPGYAYLAGKTRLSKRTVQDCVKSALKSGELIKLSQGTRGKSNKYKVDLPKLRSQPRFQVADSATSDQELGGNPGGNPGGKQSATEPLPENATSETEQQNLVAGGDGQLFGTGDEKPGPKSDDSDSREDDVWEHFVRTIEPAQTNLTPSRRRLIAKALKETDDPELLKRAISGLKAWRKKKPGDMSLSTIFSTRPGGSALGDQIDWWAQQAGEHGTHVPSVTDDRVVRRQLEVRQMHEQPHLAGVRERGEQALAWLRENAQMDCVVQEDGTLNWITWTGAPS